MVKKIIIGHNFTGDSFASMSMELAIALAEGGNEVIFVSHTPIFKNGSKHDSGVTLYSWPEKRPTGLKSVRFAVKLVKQFKPDVVLAHMASVNALILASYLCRVPLRSAYFHTTSAQIKIDSDISGDSFSGKLRLYRKNFVYRLCNKIFFPSQFALDDFRKYYHTKSRTQLIVNYNAIIEKEYVRGQTISGRFNKDRGTIKIGYLGRIDPSKGVLEMVAAAKGFLKKKPGSLILCIAGSGKCQAEIYDEVKDFSGIEFYGKLKYSDIYEYICSCDFLICPSRADNLPTVCLESLMLGVPVIGSKRGGIPEIIENGKEGYLLENLQTANFFDVFEKVLKMSSDEYKKMSEASRGKFNRQFNMDSYIVNMKEYLGFDR